MKKYFLIAAMLLLDHAYAQQAVNGKVKIYLNTISCTRETLDDLFDGDGKGNEVFVTFYYSVASSNGTTRYSNKVTTPVYGDASGRPGRIKAGTAGSNGGIRAGDNIYANPNITASMPIGDERFKGQFMFDADLGPDDIITVIPVIWEWDSDAKNTQNSFESFLLNSFNTINLHTAQVAQKFDPRTWPIIYADGKDCINIPGMTQILQGVNGTTGNRPIGMALNGTYIPNMIVLNQKILKNWRSVNALYNEECKFYYDENNLGNTRDHGNYDIAVHVDYTPPPTVNTQPVKVIQGTNIVHPVNGQATISPSITGTWKGTWTYTGNATTNFLSYQLNADGTMLLLSEVGATEARGSYTFANKLLTITYSYLGGGAYSSSGTYDPSTGKLSGTWGHNNSTNDGGKWVLTK